MEASEQYIIIVLVCILLFYYVFNQKKNDLSANDTFTTINNLKIKSDSSRYEINPIIKEGFQNLIDNKNANIILFYSKKCENSMNFIPTWNKLNKMKVNNVEFKEIEGDSDNNDDFIKYNIKYLPTLIIQFENENDFTVYKGDRSIKDIIDFTRLNGIILNTSILEGIEGFQNNEDDFSFETGIFSYDEENNEYQLKIKDKTIKFVYDLTNKKYNFISTNEFGNNITLKNYSESHNPTFGLVSWFIDYLKSIDKTDNEIVYELNKINTKKFIKHLDYGLCYDNKISRLKSYYKNNENYENSENSKQIIDKLTLLNDKVCNTDYYIRKKK
jgi:thiol-disulfide isomerase/thioredoxin